MVQGFEGMRGKSAIVTGGAGGLGEAITLDLAANGVRVAVVDRDEAAVHTISEALARRGAPSIVQVGDHSALPYADAVDAVFRAAIEPPRADTGP